MAFITPVTNWNESRIPAPEDLNRVEGNIKHIKEEDGTIDGVKDFTGNNTHSSNNTFSGDNTFSGNNTCSGTLNITGTFNTNEINEYTSGTGIITNNTLKVLFGIKPTGFVHSATTGGNIFTQISPSIPNIGDFIFLNGGQVSGGSITAVFSIAYRQTATNIQLYGVNSLGALTKVNATSGSSTTLTLSIAW